MNDDNTNLLAQHFWPVVLTLLWLDSLFFVGLDLCAQDPLQEYTFWPAVSVLLVIPIGVLCTRIAHRIFARAKPKMHQPKMASASVARSRPAKSV
jgi:hypothetical protein